MSVLSLTTSCTIVAALLALGAGLAKLWRPRSAVDAMHAVGLPSGTAAVRLGSLLECGVAVAAVVSSSWIARLLLALLYGAFTAFVAVALRSGRAVDCGCFGASGGTLGRRHLALTAALCAGVAATIPARAAAVTWQGPLHGAAVVLVGVVSALLAATYVTHEGAA